jgi:hypothetical protein
MPADDDNDDILNKADALLGRHRHVATSRRPEPPVDFPVLTDVYSPPPQAAAAPFASPPGPTTLPNAAEPGPAFAPGLTDQQLQEIERDLRLQLLQLMGPELERLIEARVHARLAPAVTQIVGRIRVDLENEIRRAVQDALNEVVEQEVARLQRDG